MQFYSQKPLLLILFCSLKWTSQLELRHAVEDTIIMCLCIITLRRTGDQHMRY